jgi:hypothetical protein
MARAKTQIERNAFVRGLITEASPLTFPENASIDERNFILNRDGSRQRRLGMDFENENTLIQTAGNYVTFPDYNINTFKWDNVNNDPTVSLGVIQVGNVLWFVDLFTTTLSNNVKNGGAGFTINTANVGFTASGTTLMDFTSIDGTLIVASQEFDNPIAITYDVGEDEVTAIQIEIDVRDIWGVSDGLAVDERPSTLDDTHKYNLLNQGWPLSRITASLGNTTTQTATTSTQLLKEKFPLYYDSDGYPSLEDFTGGGGYASGLYYGAQEVYRLYGTDGDQPYVPLANSTSATTGYYPSNADVYATGKKIDADGNPTYDFALVEEASFGSSPAPKGKFVIKAFERGIGRQNATGLDLLDDTDAGNITAVASFAGRIFYSGVTSNRTEGDERNPNYAGTLFFTQTIRYQDQFGRCYQEADPTSEQINELIASDGGTIKIPEAGQILKLIVKDASLIVIADNGVWQITGPDNVFKATEYSITQVTNVGCISKKSVVNAEGTILFFSDAGIYALTMNQNGAMQAENLTETTIQTLYNEIPTVGRANAVGQFDFAGRKISWLYNDTDAYNGIEFRKKFNKELVFDTVLKAWYVLEIFDAPASFNSGYSPFVAGYMPTQVFNTETYAEPVVHNGEQVQVNGEDVVINRTVRSRGVSQNKYVVFQFNPVDGDYYLSFAHYINADFKDWDQTDAAAYLITGQELFGDTQRKKLTNYLTLHFLRTEYGFEDTGGGNLEALGASGCLCQIRWDFANSTASGKFGTAFQGYRLRRAYFPTDVNDTFDYGWEVITTKSRLRGSGKAISFKFDTEAEKDCYLLGWAMDVEGQTNV